MSARVLLPAFILASNHARLQAKKYWVGPVPKAPAKKPRRSYVFRTENSSQNGGTRVLQKPS